MAIMDHAIFRGLRGHLNKQIVFKRYGKKTVVTRYPDMSNIKPTAAQKQRRKLFAEAVAYAKNMLLNPELKDEYTKKARKKGRNAYHQFMREFFAKRKEAEFEKVRAEKKRLRAKS